MLLFAVSSILSPQCEKAATRCLAFVLGGIVVPFIGLVTNTMLHTTALEPICAVLFIDALIYLVL